MMEMIVRKVMAMFGLMPVSCCCHKVQMAPNQRPCLFSAHVRSHSKPVVTPESCQPNSQILESKLKLPSLPSHHAYHPKPET